MKNFYNNIVHFTGIYNESRLSVVDKLLYIRVVLEEKIDNRMNYSYILISPRYMEDYIRSRRPYPDGEVAFDILSIVRKKKTRRIDFKIAKYGNETPFDLELVLEDRSMFSKRVLYQNKYNRIGGRMYFDLNDNGITKEFHISIRWVDRNEPPGFN